MIRFRPSWSWEAYLPSTGSRSKQCAISLAVLTAHDKKSGLLNEQKYIELLGKRYSDAGRH